MYLTLTGTVALFLKEIPKKIFIILLLFSFAIISGCSQSQGKYSKVKISFGYSHSASAENIYLIDRVLRFFSNAAYAASPGNVSSIIITVNGTEMEPLVYDYTSIPDAIELEIPSGKARIFYIEAKDSAGTVTYNGASTAVDLDPDAVVDITISMGKVIISISISNITAPLAIGATRQYSAIAAYADSTTADMSGSVTWTTSDPAIATINSAGLATGMADGTSIISATYNSFSSTAGITVNPWGKNIGSIAVTPLNDSIPIGLTKQFTATATFTDSTTGNVTNTITWASSDPATATINSTGLATGVAKGSATISAAYQGISGNTAFAVNSWGKIYVANFDGGNVSVIDGQTNTVKGMIPVGGGPFGVAVNDATGKVYVTNNADDTMSVIDSNTDIVIGSAITVTAGSGVSARGLDVNPITNKIYVATEYDSDIINVINGVDNTLLTGITLSDCYPYDVEVNTVTNKAYAALWCGSTSVINMSTDTELINIYMGLTDPYGVGVNPVTNKIYISEHGSNTVQVINGSTDAILYSITVGSAPYGVSVNSVTNKIYVANDTDGTVSVIDGSTDTVSKTITGVGLNPTGVTVNSNTNRIYVTNRGDGSVVVIDGSTDAVVTTITGVGATPSYLDVLL